MKRALLIYNPVSGDHSIPAKLDYIIGRFQDSGTLIQPFRFYNYDENVLVRLLEENNPDFIVISGGDGTVNYIVNVLLKNNYNIPIGLIPSGTCNDFANSLSIPTNLETSLDIIIEGNTLEVDVGLVNEQNYFLSTCAGGNFVDVSFNTHNDLKKNFGPLAYYLKGLTEVKNLRPFKLKITTENMVLEEKAFVFVILNGTQGAGFSDLIREADITDGLMDILIIKRCSHLDLAGLFFKVLSHDFRNDRNITKLTCESCKIECDADIPISIDGERGVGLPYDIRFINKALTVFVE